LNSAISVPASLWSRASTEVGLPALLHLEQGNGAGGRSEIDEQNWAFIVGAKGRATVSAALSSAAGVTSLTT
jgi:hypothetical protein